MVLRLYENTKVLGLSTSLAVVYCESLVGGCARLGKPGTCLKGDCPHYLRVWVLVLVRRLADSNCSLTVRLIDGGEEVWVLFDRQSHSASEFCDSAPA